MAHPQGTCPMDLSSLANALPQQQQIYRPPYGLNGQRYGSATMSMPQVQAHFGAPSALGHVPGQQYYIPENTHTSQYYAAPLSHQSPGALPPRTELSFYPAPLVMSQAPHTRAPYYYPPAPAQATSAGQPHPVYGQYGPGHYNLPILHHQPGPGFRQAPLNSQGVSSSPPAEQQENTPPTGSRQNIVRGPPRKPRQSGHAIWIGNLPPQTDLMSLVHHVCKEANGLQSLFLISKSNCAFANFKDEQSCSAAQRKLHDSKFMTVRLVSRLRKSTVEGPAGITAPTGPAALGPQSGAVQESGGPAGGETNGHGSLPPTSPVVKSEAQPTAGALVNGTRLQKDRFFILKSLTVEDLELSVRTNIWATQSHNEETLNSAFKTSDNVYLVFSANKSGEYFGYARMVSPINDDPAAAIEFAPSAQLATDVDLPKAIPTEPTEFAPRGRIVDDSARGTIFWEAECEERGPKAGQDEDGSGGSVVGDTNSVRSGQEGGSGVSEPKGWGKPFRLEWLSTSRLPFYRTRGLRNPWNSNREVKIARDGTEVEPSVGRRLIGLFNRAQNSAAGMPPRGMVGPPMAAMGVRGPVPVPVTTAFAPMPSQC
ncbi:hypothetical protein VTK26DRAFT_4757 [Humicola hyalothermophila]